LFGVDYAWGGPSAAALKAAGVKFVVRYLSGGSSKDLTASEKNAMLAAGIAVAVVWETTAGRALAGYAAGQADARAADAEAKRLGIPGIPVYFACDTDASNVNPYLSGAASVVGKARTGLYAGYRPIKAAFDAGVIAYGWQTYAWSGGKWDARAQLQQYSNNRPLAGSTVDFCRNTATDFGQWPRPGKPAPVNPYPDLAQGASGAPVVTLQNRLNVWGANPKLTPDGAFGPKTLVAVKAFEAARKLAVDGVVKADDWAVLKQNPAVSPPKPPAPPKPPVPAYPPAPAGLKARPQAVRLDWQPVTDSAGKPVSGYRYQVAEGTPAKPGAIKVWSLVTTNFADNVKLPRPGAYVFRVQARGNGRWSAWAVV
jgi:hypothetical protein